MLFGGSDGPHVTIACEPRQVRKEAAVSGNAGVVSHSMSVPLAAGREVAQFEGGCTAKDFSIHGPPYADPMDPLPTANALDTQSGIWTEHPVPHFRFPLVSPYPELRHAVFTRIGGTSRPPYESLNISYQVGDKRHRVSRNLARIRGILMAERLVTMRQVHGTEVAVIRSPDQLRRRATPVADAIITCLPGIAVVVRQADCQGVILYDPQRRVLGVVHCGWRGSVAGILIRVVSRMKEAFGCNPGDLLACIGPSLGPCCAEFVDPAIFPQGFREFWRDSTHLDLKAVSRHQLLQAGLGKDHIQISHICTRCRTDLFFSYRGEGITGRFATAAMLDPGGQRHATDHR